MVKKTRWQITWTWCSTLDSSLCQEPSNAWHVLQPFDFEKVTVGRPWNTETPIPKPLRFGVTCPSTSILCFISNFPIKRLLAYKVSYARQRPVPKVEEGIGAWRSILTFVAYMGVTCTCYIETWTKLVLYDSWFEIECRFHRFPSTRTAPNPSEKPVGCWSTRLSGDFYFQHWEDGLSHETDCIHPRWACALPQAFRVRWMPGDTRGPRRRHLDIMLLYVHVFVCVYDASIYDNLHI